MGELRQLRNSSPERFDYLSGVASGGCSDIDGILERHGHFLVLENKRPNEVIPTGQLITLRALNALPNFAVWVVRGAPPDKIESAGPLDGNQIPMNAQTLRRNVQRWWDAHDPRRELRAA